MGITNMPEIETAIRLIVIGQEILIAVVFLSGAGSRVARIGGALLVLSIVGYLFMSDTELRNSVPGLVPTMTLLALSVPYCLWFFARAIFEAPWPRQFVVYACALVGISVWAIYLGSDSLQSRFVSIAGITMRVLALLIVAHALLLSLKGRPDDLIERRRTFRLFFVVVISIQVTAVLLVELAQVGVSTPAWLSLVNVLIIAILTIGLAIPLLRLNGEFFGLAANTKSTIGKFSPGTLSATECVLREKLLELMDDGYFRETGLAVPVLAAKLGYPEHRLRSLINGKLGYRNFSAFLNSYRIRAAMNQLADPERARTQVLAIALDLGYASVGPFNRAFKEATGMTPTDYRQQMLGGESTESE